MAPEPQRSDQQRAGQQLTDQQLTDEQLTDQQRAVLDFENRDWPLAGAKEAAISEELHLSITRYYQVLNHLLDSPAALAAAPMLIGRLRRVREERRRTRTGGAA